MAEHYFGSISIPTRFIKDDLKAIIAKAFGKDYEQIGSNIFNYIINFQDDKLRYGRVEDLEAELIRRQIPFDAYANGYHEYQPEHYYYRPDNDIGFVTISVTLNDEEFVPIEKVRELLNVIIDPDRDRDEARKFCLELLRNYGSGHIPPLKNYVTGG